jgi:hypothetical protein
MFGKDSRLNSLASRKQLLIAESDLNRIQVVEGVAGLMAGATTLAGQMKSLASIGGILAIGIAAFRNAGASRPVTRSTWLQTALKAAGVVSNLWMAFRPKGRDRDDNQPTAKI